MELKDFIIALMAFAVAGLIIFAFTADLYSDDKLNVTLDDDTQSKFDEMNSQFKTTQDQSNEFTKEFRSYSPGGTNATVAETSLTEGELVTAGMKALVRTPTAIVIFGNILNTIAGTVGIDASIIGFILAALTITIIMIILYYIKR